MIRQTASRPVFRGDKHPSGAYDQNFIAVRQLQVCCFWRALLDGRSGLPFTFASGPHQASHSWLWVQRVSWLTVSDSKLPQPGGPGPRIYIPHQGCGPVIPQALGSLFVASYHSQDYGGGIVTRSARGVLTSPNSTAKFIKDLNQVKIMLRPTVQSTRPSWNKAPIWGLRPNLYYCQTVAGFLMWDSLWREDLSVVYQTQSAIISLLSVCTIFILQVIIYMYIQHKASVSSVSVQMIMPYY
jgi:hypothetical protein